jgi:hypothetical protein
MDITALVRANVKNYHPGMPTWFDALPPDARKMLGKVRDDYAAGAIQGQKRAVAKSIMGVAASKGWKTSGVQGVIAWLDAAANKKT